MTTRTVFMASAALALAFGMGAHGAEVKIPGWAGEPVSFSVQARYLVVQKGSVALDLDFSSDGAWAPSGSAASCVKKADGEHPYVKIGGSEKQVGLTHGVKPIRSVQLAAGTTCKLEIEARTARGDDTFIIYMRAFDAAGRDVTASAPSPQGWTYSECSKAYVRFPLPLDANGKWTTLNVPFRVPDGVAAVVPMVCMWRGRGADVRRIRITRGAVSAAREIAFDAPAERVDGATRFRSSRDELALEVVARDDGTFDAEVIDLAVPPRPRALDLTVTVPAALAGWTWHRNWREDRAIGSDSAFADANQVGGFPVTRYPFSAVSKDGAGFIFGTPLDAGVYESRVVTAKGIESRVPMGLLARGDGLGTRARFRYMLFPFKGTWGFRSAAKAYYAREAHKLPAAPAGAKEGTWVWPIWPSKGPENPDDFGHTFWEAPTSIEKHPEEIRRAHELGIGVFPYTEVWGMRQHLPTAADGSHPSVSERLAELEGWAAQTNSGKTWFDSPREEAARACLNSMPTKPDGSPAYVEDHWDDWTTWWRTNPDPRLAKPNRCSICWDHTLAPRLDEIDGVYLDSVAYGFSADFRNVRPEHLAVFDAPLIYDQDTLRPCTDGMQHMSVFIGWLAGKLRPKGKRLFGNTFHIAHRFHATNIDVFGCEVGSWGNKPGEQFLHSVITDADACEQRFFAFRRPVSNLLQEGHWERVRPETTRRGIELYIENQMFYGFYPAVSTIGGEKKVGYRNWPRYFGGDKRYERDRDLFKAAIPVIRRLNRAGWQPETLMRASDANVWIERYGEPGGGECLFTVRNASAKTIDAVLSPEMPVASLTSVWRGCVSPRKTNGGFAVRLDPWQTAVFRADFACASRTLDASRVDSRYFAGADGKTFVPVGCNICFPRMYVAGSPESRAACEEKFLGWLRTFAANGGNFVRLWLGHSFFEIMPERAGEYDPAAEASLKRTVRLCEELGIKLKLTLESFRSVHPAGKEGKRMYSAFFNRPLYAPYAKNVREFLHSEECARIYLGKARRLKALGLGDSPAVACWELWNEINCLGPWREDVGPWSDRMLAELRAMFPRQMTVQNLGSYGGPTTYDYYDYLGRIPLNDFMQIHCYLDPGTSIDVCRGPMDVLAANAVRELLDRRPDRPAVLAEVGAVKTSHTGPSELYPKDSKGMLLHDEIFAPFFAGSAGSGQPWHWDHQYIDGNGLWWHFSRFAEAVKGVDPAAEHFRPFHTETRRLRIWGLRGERTILLWCRDKANTWESELVRGEVPATISGEKIPFGSAFECYLPWENRHVDVKGGGTLPDFTRSIVVRLKRR